MGRVKVLNFKTTINRCNQKHVYAVFVQSIHGTSVVFIVNGSFELSAQIAKQLSLFSLDIKSYWYQIQHSAAF